jgi:hypothetical protein
MTCMFGSGFLQLPFSTFRVSLLNSQVFGQRAALILLLRITLVGLVIAVIWASLKPNGGATIAGSDKLAHGLAYMSLALVGLNNFRLLANKALFVAFALMLGALMEYGQSFVPGRDMSAEDMLANSIGVALGIVFYIPFSLWRKRRNAQLLKQDS